MTDNIAIRRGFTRYVLADSDEVSLHLLIKPNTDLDSTFRACFLGQPLSSARITSMIPMNGPSLGFTGGFDRRWAGGERDTRDAHNP
jgi:hypothetical protein